MLNTRTYLVIGKVEFQGRRITASEMYDFDNGGLIETFKLKVSAFYNCFSIYYRGSSSECEMLYKVMPQEQFSPKTFRIEGKSFKVTWLTLREMLTQDGEVVQENDFAL